MFCTQCGKEADGKFCAHCGAEAHSSIVPSSEQLVVAEILIYVDENWPDDFSDFLDAIQLELECARQIIADPQAPVDARDLGSLELAFSEFISGGGFPADQRFGSLKEFIEEMN
jgi:hypothetical protein